ncbi:unnamed protein product [Coregonus sp. 'balchen']|nr:unnamed protein product [Coregonus sp. 'balchen']
MTQMKRITRLRRSTEPAVTAETSTRYLGMPSPEDAPFWWRIVIHGAVDGYSRLVVFLKASDNNRSATVMESIEAANTCYGIPSRVRCDQGGENNRMCAFMEQFRGGERGSALRGRSTHNRKIERLWGDVWHGVVYHDLITFLETEQIININNEVHLWALHFVFLSRVNRDLALFPSQWNHHGLRTEQRQSPLQFFVSGALAMQRANLTAVRDLFAPASTTITSQATTSAPPTTTSTTTSAPPTTTSSTSAPPTTTSTISAPPTTTTTSSTPPTTTTSSAPPTTTISAPPTTTISAPPTTTSTISALPTTTTTSSTPPTTTTSSAPPTTTISAPPTTTSTISAPPTTTTTSTSNTTSAPPTTTTSSAPPTTTSAPPTTTTTTSAPPTTTTTTTSAPPTTTTTSAPPTTTTSSAPPTTTTSSAPPTTTSNTTSAPPTTTTSAPPTTGAAALYCSEGVIVPQIQFPISNTQMELLRTINPLEGPRGSLGVDILQRVMAHSPSFTHCMIWSLEMYYRHVQPLTKSVKVYGPSVGSEIDLCLGCV